MMQMFLAMLILVLFLLTACENKKTIMIQIEDTEADSYPYDQSSFESFITTKQAIYCRRDGVVLFCPTGAREFIPLCGKPDCAHNSGECNAWVGFGSGLGYYKNRLFAVISERNKGSDNLLVSMKLDGTDRREVLELPALIAPDGSRGGMYYYVLADGRLFCTANYSDEIPYEDRIQHFFVVDLDTLECTEPFAEELARHTEITWDYKPLSDQLYATCVFTEENGKQESWFSQLDLTDGSVQKLFQNEAGGEYVQDNTIYYFDPEHGFREFDLKTMNINDCASGVSGMYWAKRWGNMIIGGRPRNDDRENTTIYFFDLDYQLVDQLVLHDGLWPVYYGEEALFFSNTGTAINAPISAYLERSAVGSGKVELLPCGKGN